MQTADNIIILAGPDVSFCPVVARSSNPGRLGFLSLKLFIGYTLFKLFKGIECAVLSMVLCTIKKP